MNRMKGGPGRLGRNPIVLMILGFAAVFVIPAAANKVILKPAFSSIFQNQGLADILRYLLSFFLFGTVYTAFFKISEKRPISELSLAGLGKNVALGIALAAGAMGVILGVAASAGIYAIDGVNPGFGWLRVSAGIAVLAFGEELMFRGILFRIAQRAFGTLPSLIAIAALFGGLHLVNPGAHPAGILSAALGGIVTGLLFAWRRNLWFCTAFHAGWNMIQAVFGSNISGLDMFGTYFKAKISGPEILTGGTFGLEASLITLVVLAALAAGLALTLRRQSPSS